MIKSFFSKQTRIDPIIFEDLKVPLLILDPLWQEQFRDRKTDKINNLETKTKGILKEISRLTEAEKKLKQKKKECLSQIRKLTVDVHDYRDKDAIKATELFKIAVVDINSELDELGRMADKLPKDLERVNRELLAETVSIIYFSMYNSKERLESLTPEIERLRGEVHRLTLEQIECEEETGRTYQLLHKMVGREVVNILDQQFQPVET